MGKKFRFGIIHAKDDPELEAVSKELQNVGRMLEDISEQINGIFGKDPKSGENQAQTKKKSF
ncbi:hypothetical protein [Thermoflavimicrobium daqui]|uniref:Uncharacterized protein n=1 Tax=Thermoflavimicrobium daqui TaxID=2137476 RepID=A0A364K165_9BACL|nr:hypothetical protein [Thermoflavimicrobium daqui]RAL21439.1 hypothetical protein DL897_16485 [Thermoflavimicrobium daqui]